MGNIAALDCLEGRSIQHNSKMKVFVIAALMVAVSADPYYGYGGYGYGGHYGGGASYVGRTIWGLRGKRSAEAEADPAADAYYGYYGHQYAWPSATGYYGTSTCYGCRGKRSAEPGLYYGLGHYGYGLGLIRPGIAAHPGLATSYSDRSVQGIRGKRSAEAEADAEPHYGYGHLGYAGYGYGLPAGYARFGGHYLGKREAEAEPYYGYGLGYYGRGYYGGYGHRYGYGYGYYG